MDRRPLLQWHCHRPPPWQPRPLRNHRRQCPLSLPRPAVHQFHQQLLSGPLPDIGRLDALKSIYLSRNRFSGSLPDSLFSKMDHLKKLWLDNNALSGAIPSSLSNATSLMELHLEGNAFSGAIPSLSIPSLRSFNVSNNKLQGLVPASLQHFGASAFEANSDLCGQPTGSVCPPAPPISPPPTAAEPTTAEPSPIAHAKSNHFALILVGIVFVVLALAVGLAFIRKRQPVRDFDSVAYRRDGLAAADAMETASVASTVVPFPGSAGQGKQLNGSGETRVGSGGGGVAGNVGGGAGAELVMVNSERETFGLADLMKSAAEVLGNGLLGSAYKAVMSGGLAVAVKRMRELTRLNKEAFDEEMKRFGRLRHPNVLTPLAYHYRKEEKLIVSDYVAKGSLLYMLHGDRGADHAALDWATRLKIVRGIARGMAYLHVELSTYEVPHGNLKTANVLLTPSFDPVLADYGLAALVNPATAANVLFSYKSPEFLQFRRVSPKSDVYCFGIVVLELLTGKFPSQYLNNTKGGTDVVQWTASAISDRREADLLDPAITSRAPPTPEMVRLLRVGSACTQPNPNERPDMKEAADLVEEIAAAVGIEGGVTSGREETASSVAPCPVGPEEYAEQSGSLHGSRAEAGHSAKGEN
ncbi:hypothetical protein HPP92_011062 [Vanilla planifolia]|uniref:Protein kinase domain-containing protein n=1 Tax=Vanilla planifolia TaxID=51239 RepID=A0A835UY37_VANPL|nr:hypothetical protein HPP92_011062 [Vanilla planifolia]